LESLWDAYGTEFIDDAYGPITGFLYSWMPPWDAETAPQFGYFQEKDIREVDVTRHISTHMSVGPDSEFAKRVLKVSILSCRTEWNKDGVLLRVATWYCKRLNELAFRNGMPERVGFTTVAEELEMIPAMPCYYDCLSTLAINVVGNEYAAEHFYESHPTNRFVAAAQSICDAGYVEHALVFLGYALLRICFICQGVSSAFSVSEVDRFISQPHVWPRVEKWLLPLIEVIEEQKDDLPFASTVWIKALKGRFKSADLHVLKYDVTVASAQHPAPQIPKWCDDGDTHLKQALMDCARVLRKTMSPSDGLWQRIFESEKLRGALTEVSQSVEEEVKEMFRGMFNAYWKYPDFRETFVRMNPDARRLHDRLDVGWIESFIDKCIKGKRDNHMCFSKVIESVSKVDEAMGRRIRQLGSAQSQLDALAHFRRLDNRLSHKDKHNRTSGYLSLMETRWLVEYATREFGALYSLFE
jgi:hypothetical protein